MRKGYVNTNVYRAENNVKTADNYAIEFAEWCNELRLYGEGYYEKSLKELLEIFKKEKGL